MFVRQRRSVLRHARRFGVLAAVALSAGAAVGAPTRISNDPSMYARVRQLADGELIAAMTGFAGGNHIDVYASADGGVSFRRVSQITDPEFATGLCCGSIFQLPRAIGALPAGTLLWAGSVGQDAGTNRRMKIKVYRSGDNGRTWSFSSSIASPNAGGVWEPEFSIASDGALVMMYSDETDQAVHGQKLVRVRSYDGVSWIDRSDMIASAVRADRPGMAVVSRRANGSRVMTYELCGPARCTVFYKTSADGWDWGDARQVGTAIRLPDGRYFEHAPYSTVLPGGALLVVGQVLMNADGTTAAGNGTTIFRSQSGDPAGPWTTIQAPVGVPNAYNHPCPNYSSPLLSVGGGAAILELAGRLENGSCYMYYGRGAVN